jgi:hypothetical protein
MDTGEQALVLGARVLLRVRTYTNSIN